jgi:hypothetical protein
MWEEMIRAHVAVEKNLKNAMARMHPTGKEMLLLRQLKQMPLLVILSLLATPLTHLGHP